MAIRTSFNEGKCFFNSRITTPVDAGSFDDGAHHRIADPLFPVGDQRVDILRNNSSETASRFEKGR